MKRTLFSLLLLGAAFAFSSCETGIYDWVTASLYVTITDADGQNLLDPMSEGYLLAAGDAVLSFPEGYYIKPSVVRTPYAETSAMGTRAYVGPWVGALVKDNPDGQPSLFIGEFNQGADTDLTLTFASGEAVAISVYHVARPHITGPRLLTKSSVISAPDGWNVKVDLSKKYTASEDDLIPWEE